MGDGRLHPSCRRTERLWAGAWRNPGTTFDWELMLAGRSGVSHVVLCYLEKVTGLLPLLFWNLIWGPQTATMSWVTAMSSKLGWQGWLGASSRHRMLLEIFRWWEGWVSFSFSVMLFEEIGLYMNIKEISPSWVEERRESLSLSAVKY